MIDFTDYVRKHEDESLYDIIKKIYPNDAYRMDSSLIKGSSEVVGLYFQKIGSPDFLVVSHESGLGSTFRIYLEVISFMRYSPKLQEIEQNLVKLLGE